MLYLHDVWVSWLEEDNPNLVPYFHEWKKDEVVELMDQIPLLKVNTNLYNYIIFGSSKLNDEILKGIENKGYHRKNCERVLEKYAFVCSDGMGIMAVILDAYGNVKKKSRLIPRQFQLAIEMIDCKNNDYELDKEIDVSQFKTYFGMTRLEKGLITNILGFIDKLDIKNEGLLRYLISEWDINLHRNSINSNFEDIKNKLLSELKNKSNFNLIEFNNLIDKLKVIN